MKTIKVTTLGFICTFILMGTVNAEENALKGIKLGFGYDRGLGIVGTMDELNGFIGNKGVAVDYIIQKDTLEVEIGGSVFWYISGGGYGDWDGDFGARLPVGLEWYFAKKLDAYAQVIPHIQVKDKFEFGLDFGIGVRYQL